MIGVCIVTYNQEKYIAQTIESVLTQRDCGHDVVAYIGNDCSSDRTGEICHQYAEKYPNRIKIIDNSQNLGLVGNTMNLLDIMRNDGCDFIAMLDGDDYWSDNYKLQKQIKYFEAHPEYGLVHTYVDTLYPDGLHVEHERKVQEGIVWPIVGSYSIGNCSVMFRKELLDLINFKEFQEQGLMSCDYSMYIIFASKTQFGFLPEHTAVWRRGIESVSGTKNIEKQIQYVRNDLAHWRYLAKLFPEKWTYTEQDGENYMHTRAFNIALRYGDRKRAIDEAQLLNEDSRKRYRLKILIAHSAIMTYIWSKLKSATVR